MVEERRLVTVVFADVSGSTALGESLDPEALRSLLARFFAAAREIIESHGGTVEKFIGDAVMAVFGLPQAHGDDAARALAAALELRDRIREDETLGDRLPIRLGVNTGEVVATRDSKSGGDFLLTGDAVNVAARLQQSAEPWSIVAGERTVHAAGEAFRFGPLLRLDAKGKKLDVVAAQLLGRAAPPARRRLPLVGRDGDLAQLELTAQRAVGERRPFLVTILAPAGTGKTRLLEEFIDHLDANAPEVQVAVAQCLPYGQRLTYWPLRALLQQLADLPKDAAPDRMRPSIERWLEELGDDSPEHSAELIAATLGAVDSDVADRSAIFAAWRRAVELAAARRPLVLVLEDLHWSSDSLLDLIEFVLQPRGDLPLLMIALSRPELLDRRPAWGGGRRNYLSLALEPLDDAAIEKLVGNLLDGRSARIVAGVVARADGNPFYAGEIVRSIVERVSDLTDEVAVEEALAGLPDTVQATVLARLDLLPAPARRLLQVGSVFGRAFRRAGVAALDPTMAVEGEAPYDALIDRDLLRASGHDAFTFRHILIREGAYATMTRAERASLHSAAAEWLAAGSDEVEAIAELIAYHYREAVVLGQAVGLEVDQRLRRRAVEWLTKAADVATAAAANQESARHLRAAIDLAGKDELPELYVRLGDVYFGGDEGARAYAEAYRRGRELGRGPDFLLRALASRLTTVMRFHASIAHQLSEPEMIALRSEAASLVERAQDERSRAIYFISEGFYPFWLSNSVRVPTAEENEISAKQARLGLEIAERLGDASLVSAGLDSLTSSAGFRDVPTILGLSRRRIDMGDRLVLLERLDAHHMVAWMNCLLGDFGEALRVSLAGSALVLPGQSANLNLAVAGWQPLSLAMIGRWDEALAAADRAGGLWVEEEATPTPGFALHGFIAALWVARGRRDQSSMERWREVVEQIAARYEEGHPTRELLAVSRLDLDGLADVVAQWQRYTMRLHLIERVLAMCADHRQLVPAAALDDIVSTATGQGLRPLEAQARRMRGIQARREDDFRTALAMYQAMGSVPHIGRVETELGELVGDETLLATGLGRLEALGDLDQIARVRRVSSLPS